MTLVTLQPLARIEAHRPQLSPLVSVYERSTRMTKDGASGVPLFSRRPPRVALPWEPCNPAPLDSFVVCAYHHYMARKMTKEQATDAQAHRQSKKGGRPPIKTRCEKCRAMCPSYRAAQLHCSPSGNSLLIQGFVV